MKWTVLAAAVLAAAALPPRSEGLSVDNSAGAAIRQPGVARLQGDLSAGPADVVIYWDTADRGAGDLWAHRLVLTNVSDGAFSGTVSNLLYGITYYYRCRASNAGDTAWAPATASFTTLKPWHAVSASLRHRWSFNDGSMQDSVGPAHGAAENGNVAVDGRRLRVAGPGRMLTAPVGAPIGARTLVVWTSLLDPAQSTGGSPLTLEDSAAGAVYDGIAYGWLLTAKWSTGSEAWNRTQRPQGFGTLELVADPGEVMMAVVYAADNSVTLYRNGVPYGTYRKGSLVTYGGASVVQIGRRYGTTAETYLGCINEARIYAASLTATNLVQLRELGPDSLGTSIRLTNAPPTDLTADTATLHAALSCSGAVYVAAAYWGASDGGTNAGDWDHVGFAGAWTNRAAVALSCLATGVSPASACFFTFRATNAADDIWARPALRFGPLAVDNDGGAAVLHPGGARLRGVLYSSEAGEAVIYWGTADGGTNGEWQHATRLADLGDGPFAAAVSNLEYNTTYFYRCWATNRTGAAWAPATTNFILLPPPPRLVVTMDEKSSGNQLAYAAKVSSTDLVNRVNTSQTTLDRVGVTGYRPYLFGPAASITEPDFILNNGSHGNSTILEPDLSGNAAFDGDWGEKGDFAVTYYLNTQAAPAGYDLRAIDLFTAHTDNRAAQNVAVLVDAVTPGETWLALGSFSSPTPGGSQQAHHMRLASSEAGSPFATGAAAIRFVIWGTLDYGDVWREIDVQGEPTQDPLPALLLIVQ